MSKKSVNTTKSARGKRDPQAIPQQPQHGSPDSADASQRDAARLPHERDESPDATRTGRGGTDPARNEIRQAEIDVERGLKDTDRRGIPNDIPHQERSNATRNTNPRT